MTQIRNSGNSRRVFICRIAAVSMLPAAIGTGVWAADCSQDGSVVPDRDAPGAEGILPLAEKPEQDVFLAARILLAERNLDPQTRLIEYPVAFLQRNLRLPYQRACRLADALEQIGDWSSPERNCRTVCCNRPT